jgi:hypothetical protein
MTNKKATKWILLPAAVIGILILVSGYSDLDVIIQIRQAVLQYAGYLLGLILFFAIVDFILGRIRNLGDKNSSFINNFITIAVFFAVLIYGLSNSFENQGFQKTILDMQRSVESGLAGLICIVMIGGLYRLSKFRKGRLKTFFVLSAIIFLIIYSGIFYFFPENQVLLSIIGFIQTLPMGGIYGLLLGIGIGGLVTGIRVLFLAEHPYNERKR